MRFPCWSVVFVYLIRFVAVTTSDHVSLEDQLAVGSNSGRRTGRLYCRVGIGFHLQIHTDGRVNGSHEPSQLNYKKHETHSNDTVLTVNLPWLSRGHYWCAGALCNLSGGCRNSGAFSKRFLAMNKRGRLHAIEEFTDDCAFRERFQDSSYNTYASVKHGSPRTGREWFVALNKRGKAKMGSSPRVKSQHASTHFLPRFPLQDRTQWGFTVLDRSREAEGARHAGPPKVPLVKVKVETGQTRSEPLKYWPKFRFG